MAANDAVTQAARTADAMVPAAPALALPELAAAAPASRPARRPLAKSGAAERLATADMQARFAAPDRAFVAMRLALSAEAQRWTWRRDRGPEQPIGDALTGWLAELDSAAASHWAPAPPVRASEPSSSVQLLREGRVMHTLQLGAGEVRWDATDTDGSTGESRVAALEPQRALALRQALSRIAP